MRTCIKCGESKSDDAFYLYKHSNKPRGACKICTNAANAARAAANPEKTNARSKAWRLSNPERASEIIKRSYETAKAWRQRHPDQYRQILRRRVFGIDFDSMWKAQKGSCALCGGPMAPSGKRTDSVCVDHDRACCSGKTSCGKCVRGLIHWSCNLTLGYAKDNPELLRRAAEYVEQAKQRLLGS